MVGSGSVITRDVPAYGLMMGNPARLKGFVCPCGEKLVEMPESSEVMHCPKCGFTTVITNKNIIYSLTKEQIR